MFAEDVAKAMSAFLMKHNLLQCSTDVNASLNADFKRQECDNSRKRDIPV